MAVLNKYISFSGGVESTTMCILYGSNAKAIWADTGSEHKLMYQRIEKVESEIRKIHPRFEIIKLKAEAKYKGEVYDNLEKLTIAQKFMPSNQARFCTRLFKIEPIDRYLSEQEECELMIGLNADEENSRVGNWGLQSNVKYTYPLIDDGLTRDDCEAILNEHCLHPNMPVYMSRGGCRMCFFKSKKEYKAMYFLANDEFNEVMAFENAIQDKRQKFYSIMGNGISLEQLSIECERERSFMGSNDWKELYKSLKKETSCGAFCHR
jgi:3'-phosphoadenosine 5'-phosphosulfate sulfotransferase (PAPS reductase)/FAD synthetase